MFFTEYAFICLQPLKYQNWKVKDKMVAGIFACRHQPPMFLFFCVSFLQVYTDNDNLFRLNFTLLG
jgi:hypothetical protein